MTYSLAVDLNIPMIGMLRRKAEKVIIDTALKGLKRRVESASVTSRRADPAATLPRRARRAVHRQGRRRQDDARRGHRRAARALRAARCWWSPPTPRTRSATRSRPTSAASPPSWTPGCSPRTSTRGRCSTARGRRLQGHLRTVLAGAGRRRAGGRRADRAARRRGAARARRGAPARRDAGRGRSWSSTAGRRPRRCGCSACPRRCRRTWNGCSRPTAAPCAGCSPASPAAGRDAQPAWDRTVDALDALAEQLQRAARPARRPATTSIRLVLTPERVVAAETRRTLTALALHGLRVDGLVANRVLPGPPPSLRGPAGALAARAARRAAGRARRAGRRCRCRCARPSTPPPSRPACPHCWSSADALYGADDPVAPAAPPARRCCRCAAPPARGTSLDSEFELVLRLPGAADGPLDLARVDDDLAVTAGGTRRMVALPSVLRRCTVTARPPGRRRPVRRVRARPRGVAAGDRPGDGGAAAGTRALGRGAAARSRAAPRSTGSSPCSTGCASDRRPDAAPATLRVVPGVRGDRRAARGAPRAGRRGWPSTPPGCSRVLRAALEEGGAGRAGPSRRPGRRRRRRPGAPARRAAACSASRRRRQAR